MYDKYMSAGAASFSIGALVILLDQAGLPMTTVGALLALAGFTLAYLANKYHL